MSWVSNISRGVLIAIAAVIVIAGIMFAGVYGGGWFQRTTANYRGQTSAIEKTRANGDFRLHAYKHFFDLCAGVQAKEGQAQILKPLATDDVGRTNLAAVQAERLTLITTYNADASAKFTTGQFLDSHLPYQLDPNQEHTQCALGS